MSPLAYLFAGISVASAMALLYLMYADIRRADKDNGMAAFRRHLDALSDDSRAHLRRQLEESRTRLRGE